MATTSSSSSRKMAVKDFLGSAAGGLTFRKTFTPKRPPPLPPPAAATAESTSSVQVQQLQTNDRKIFNRLCDLFGKDVSDMTHVLSHEPELSPARAAAEVFGYTYDREEEQRQVHQEDNRPDSAASSNRSETEEQIEMKDRLMREIKDKISERRRHILQQRRELMEQQDQEDENTRDLWTAVPALADPDVTITTTNSSFSSGDDDDTDDASVRRMRGEAMKQQGNWDPDAAFSEVERVLESLQSNASLDQELVERFRQQQQHLFGHGSEESEEDKNSDDSGMSSSADTSPSSSATTTTDATTPAVEKPSRKSQIRSDLHIFTITQDSPSVIDLTIEPKSNKELRNSAGEVFGSIRSNLSAGASTVHRIALQVSEGFNQAGNGLARAAEPLVQHLQLLGVRLQVRYMHSAARHAHWLPRFAMMREASDWIEGIPKSQNGFEELRLHVKEGGDLGKELTAILQERSELEASYAKNLAKLASKLLKTTSDLQGPHGTVTAAWSAVAMQMEAEAELHKSLSVSMTEELVKPLKSSVESQHRVRKAVESGVDKTGRVLAEWRSAQAKAKKQCYLTARDNEKMQDQVFTLNNANGNGGNANGQSQRTPTDKETTKLEAKCKKAQESARKAEGEYYTCCTRAERSRIEWEATTQRGGRCLYALEQERLTQLKDLLAKYYACLRDHGPRICQTVERILSEPVTTSSVESDLQRVQTLHRDVSTPPFAEQLLPDFYAEHMSNVMNRQRRRESIERCLHWVRSDVERESRGKRGVENLARALQDTPHFGSQESQQEVHQKLMHLRSMLAFLEVTRVKLHNTCSELEPNRFRKVDHPLFKYLEVHKDKQGMMQSVLKLPHWIENEDIESPPDNIGRQSGDGNSGQPEESDSDFSESEGDCSSHSVVQVQQQQQNASDTNGAAASAVPSVGRCRALYSYTANMYDELSIQPGDLINIHDKQADGWWLGELAGTVGIFPATYVEEV